MQPEDDAKGRKQVHRYKVYVNGNLAHQFEQKIQKGWVKFQYFGKKKTANGYDYHHVDFL